MSWFLTGCDGEKKSQGQLPSAIGWMVVAFTEIAQEEEDLTEQFSFEHK